MMPYRHRRERGPANASWGSPCWQMIRGRAMTATGRAGTTGASARLGHEAGLLRVIPRMPVLNGRSRWLYGSSPLAGPEVCI